MGPKTAVTEAFLTNSLDALKANLLDTLDIQLKNSIEALKTEIIENLINENKRLSKKCDELEKKVSELYNTDDDLIDRLYELECGVYDQNQRSRKNNIEISGVPNDVLDENLENTIVTILNECMPEQGTNICSSDIEACHRLPAKNGPKPVIVRFHSRKIRNTAFELRRSINNFDHSRFGIEENDKLWVNDNLSPMMKKLHFYARKLKRANKISRMTSDYGLLKIKIKERDNWKRILHPDDFVGMFPNFKFDDE